MKILVCISKTPETTAKVGFKDDNRVYDEDGVQFIMNPYDEWYALVKALEVKEAKSGEVVIFNVGSADNDAIIRKGLAIGADKAVRCNAEAISARFVAHQIANYAKAEDFDAIFTGKETIDFNGAEVGGMVAELLDLPYISFASDLNMNGDVAQVTRDIEGGVEVSEISGRFVLSASKGLAEQRIPNMRGIMMAKRKPLDIIEPVEVPSLTESVNFTLPKAKTGVKMVDPENMDELVRLLHEEAKVL